MGYWEQTALMGEDRLSSPSGKNNDTDNTDTAGLLAPGYMIAVTTPHTPLKDLRSFYILHLDLPIYYFYKFVHIVYNFNLFLPLS